MVQTELALWQGESVFPAALHRVSVPSFAKIHLSTHYLIRTGAWGEISEFRSADGTRYDHTDRVICRTHRGLEIGEVVSASPESDGFSQAEAAVILRRMGVEDELLHKRLERHKRKAVEDCRRGIDEAGIEATLLEVEQLFDGRTLLFHFLGETTPELEKITGELADTYEENVRSRHFAKLLSEGCGPGCGTKEGGGCSGGCAVCVVASACKTAAE